HFYRWKTQEKTLFSVDLGSYETTYTWIEKGNLKKSHHIPLGVETLLEALFQDRKKVLLKEEVAPAAKQIDLLLLKQGFNPNLTLALNDLRNESSKIYYSLFQEEKIPVFVTGRTDALIHLKEYLFSDAESLLSQDEELYA